MDLLTRLGQQFKSRLIAQIFSVVSGAILIVALARLLEPDDYGLLFLALSVFSIARLFSRLGVAKSAAKYLAEYKETSPGQIPHILRFSFIFVLVLTTVVSILLIIGRDIIAQLINEPGLVPFLLIGGGFVFFGTILNFANRTLQGFESIKTTAVLLALDRVGRLCFALGLVLLGYGALGALIGYIIAVAIASVVGILYLYVNHYRTIENPKREPGIRRRITEYSFPLAATGAADKIDKQLDTVLVGFFIGPTAVAFYTVGKQVITFIETPMNALGFTISPTYEAQKAKGNPETAARIYEEALFHGLLLYIPAAAGLILTAEPLVKLVFGNQYLGAVPVLQILAVYGLLNSITIVTSNGLDFLGRARERAVIKIITSILNVILNIILIPSIGVVGAAIATVATFGIYTLACVYIVTLELEVRITYIIYKIAIIFGITLLMSGPVYLAVEFVTGFVTLFVVIGLGVVLWGISVLSLGLIDVNKVLSVL